MTQIPHDFNSQDGAGSEAEETLRQLVRLPPPTGLETRVHNRLAGLELSKERRSFWALWRPVQRLQFAGAAALAVAVAVSAWSVYRNHPQPPTQTQAQPVPLAAPPKPTSSSFSTAGAERRPSNLAPIRVGPAPKKKPSASHAASHASGQGVGQPLKQAAQPIQ